MVGEESEEVEEVVGEGLDDRIQIHSALFRCGHLSVVKRVACRCSRFVLCAQPYNHLTVQKRKRKKRKENFDLRLGNSD